MFILQRVPYWRVILSLVCLVAMVATSLAATRQVVAAENVFHFPNRPVTASGADCGIAYGKCWWYVAGRQEFPKEPKIGVYAKMTQHQPKVQHPALDHSLAEIAAINSPDLFNIDAIEEGWMVSPNQFQGDERPHLFIYRTIGSQIFQGCWTLHKTDCNWHQVSKKPGHTPGDPVAVTDNVEQYGILYDPAPDGKGNWWVNYQNDWIGWFAGDDWPNHRFTQFTKAQWYGEVQTGLVPDCTAMGNGTKGSEDGSAKIDDMGLIAPDGGQWPANAYWHISNASIYNAGHFVPNDQAFHSFTYGGPGSC